jgi:hypothetical protein
MTTRAGQGQPGSQLPPNGHETVAHLGFSRVVALYERSSTLHRIHEEIRYLFLKQPMRPGPTRTTRPLPAARPAAAPGPCC